MSTTPKYDRLQCCEYKHFYDIISMFNVQIGLGTINLFISHFLPGGKLNYLSGKWIR